MPACSSLAISTVFVDNQQVVRRAGCRRYGFETSGFGVNFQQPMDGPRLISAGFGHPLGGAPRISARRAAGSRPWRCQYTSGWPLTMVVLPTPGPPVMTSHLRHRAGGWRDLAWGQRQTGLSLATSQSPPFACRCEGDGHHRWTGRLHSHHRQGLCYSAPRASPLSARIGGAAKRMTKPADMRPGPSIGRRKLTPKPAVSNVSATTRSPATCWLSTRHRWSMSC